MPDSTITDFADARANELCSAGLETGLRTFTLDDRSGLLVHVAPQVFESVVNLLSEADIERSTLTPPLTIHLHSTSDRLCAPDITPSRRLVYAVLGDNKLCSYALLHSNGAVESLITFPGELTKACQPDLRRHARKAMVAAAAELSRCKVKRPYSVCLTTLSNGESRLFPLLSWRDGQNIDEVLQFAFDDLD